MTTTADTEKAREIVNRFPASWMAREELSMDIARALAAARRAALTEAAEIAREQARPHGIRWWQISEKIAAAIERARDGQE